MSVTFKDARQALARETGGWIEVVANAGGLASATCPEAFIGTTLPSSALAYRWVFSPAAVVPRQTRITETGLNSTTGQLTFHSNLGTAVAAGTTLELSSFLPCEQQVADGNFGQSFMPGYNECVRWATEHVYVPQDDYTLTIVSGQRDYDLPSWLDRPERLVAVRHRDPLDTDWIRSDDHGHRYELHLAADGPFLRFLTPFRPTTGTHYLRLEVLRPANTFIKVGGFWTDSTAGLVDEDDEVGLDLNQIVPVALVYAYEAIRQSRTGAARASYDALYQRQVPLARAVRNYIKDHDVAPSVPVTAPPPPQAASPAA